MKPDVGRYCGWSLKTASPEMGGKRRAELNVAIARKSGRRTPLDRLLALEPCLCLLIQVRQTAYFKPKADPPLSCSFCLVRKLSPYRTNFSA